MPVRHALAAVLAATALTSCTAGGPGPYADRRDRVPPARITGPDEACVPITHIRSSVVRDGRTIDFLSSSGRGWRNVLPYSCPGLASERAFSYRTSLSQLCSTDIIYVLNQSGGGIQTGAGCGLGRFTPIELRR